MTATVRESDEKDAGIGPDETTIDTIEPAITFVSPTGDWLMTIPAGLELNVVVATTCRPEPVMATLAADCVMPT